MVMNDLLAISALAAEWLQKNRNRIPSFRLGFLEDEPVYELEGNCCYGNGGGGDDGGSAGRKWQELGVD